MFEISVKGMQEKVAQTCIFCVRRIGNEAYVIHYYSLALLLVVPLQLQWLQLQFRHNFRNIKPFSFLITSFYLTLFSCSCHKAVNPYFFCVLIQPH